MAVAVHELTTNAAKYGALSVPEGRVEIAWSYKAGEPLTLRWTETGGPAVKPPTRQGFGTRVMEAMVQSQLNGKIGFDWRSEGLVCEIEADNGVTSRRCRAWRRRCRPGSDVRPTASHPRSACGCAGFPPRCNRSRPA